MPSTSPRTSDNLALEHLSAGIRYLLAAVLLRSGGRARARQLLDAVLPELERQADRRLAVWARAEIALAELLSGALEAAERDARGALAAAAPSQRAYVLALLARIVLARSNPAEALELAREAHEMLLAGGQEEGGALPGLALTEALVEAGLPHAARSIAATTRDQVLERAERIADDVLRASFLREVWENARILACAQELEARISRVWPSS